MLAAEVGGQWSEETALFLGALAKARAQESPQLLQGALFAVWQGRSQSRCWSRDQSPALGRTLPPCMRCRGTPDLFEALVVRVVVLFCCSMGDSLVNISHAFSRKNV